MCHLKIWSFSTPLLGASQLDRSINLSKFLLQQLLLVVLNRGCGDAKKGPGRPFQMCANSAVKANSAIQDICKWAIH